MTVPRLLAITPPVGIVDARCVGAWKEAGALDVGLAVLLREPGARPEALVHHEGRSGALIRACEREGVPVLLSCDAEALPSAAELVQRGRWAGVQLKNDPDEAALARARSHLPQALLGRSCHGVPPLLEPHMSVDYTCFAPVHAPRTASPWHKQPAGLDVLRRWTRHSASVLALGGITPDNAEACLRAGAYGIAGISLFFGARPGLTEDVARLVRMLRAS